MVEKNVSVQIKIVRSIYISLACSVLCKIGINPNISRNFPNYTRYYFTIFFVDKSLMLLI